jgi:hypothetical protein
MTKVIHHNVVKRATRLGFEFTDNGEGNWRLKRLEDGLLSIETFTSTAEAFEAWEAEEVEFETEEDAEEGSRHCGVMVKSYHDIYSHNPHGPGCGDRVDIEMRNAIMVPTADGKGTMVDEAALRKIGEDAGLWREKWNGLNVGMRRMNLTNRIRGLLRNNPEAKVEIGGQWDRWGVVARLPKAKTSKKVLVAA